jgi:hypothetical protein
MGVMACDRKDCDNVMCDHYSYDYGYICYDCIHELKDCGPCDIQEFMNTPKTKTLHRLDQWDSVVNFEFRDIR